MEGSFGKLVQALMPGSALPALSRSPSVNFVRPPLRMRENAIGGEEVAASLASAWQAKNFTGKGVKIAIIDGGFQGLSQRQAEGEIPSDVVTMDFCGGHFADATEHGTAVTEIVHEMAPDAKLYLLCIDTEVDLANAEAFAKSQGVTIINHSIGWYNSGRGDGSGPIGAVVSDARAHGILWVNAAGNDAQTHWSGTFNDPNGDKIHEFAPNGDVGNSFFWPNNAVICGFLEMGRVARGPIRLRLVPRRLQLRHAAGLVDRQPDRHPATDRGSLRATDHGRHARGLLGDRRLPRHDIAEARSLLVQPAAPVRDHRWQRH